MAVRRKKSPRSAGLQRFPPKPSGAGAFGGQPEKQSAQAEGGEEDLARSGKSKGGGKNKHSFN